MGGCAYTVQYSMYTCPSVQVYTVHENSEEEVADAVKKALSSPDFSSFIPHEFTQLVRTLYMYLCVCMYVCVYVCVYMCVCICVCVFLAWQFFAGQEK